MKTTKANNKLTSAALRIIRNTTFTAMFLLTVFLLTPAKTSNAGNAIWARSRVNGDWDNAASWRPMTVPNSSTDTAGFGSATTTNVFTTVQTTVGAIVFKSGASAFTITASSISSFPGAQLIIAGTGVTNKSGVTQQFVSEEADAGETAYFLFKGSAAAGNQTMFTCNGASHPGVSGGYVFFTETSSATNSTFVSNAASKNGAGGGVVNWSSTGSPGNSTFTSNGGSIVGAGPGTVFFASGSTAGNATLIANGGSNGDFGGQIEIANGAFGTPRVEVFGNGTLYLLLDANTANVVTIGSLEGDGLVNLNENKLIVGGNNLSTTFSGIISGEGALTKNGQGQLILSAANSYTGRTIISQGTLLVTNGTDSATGTGTVVVEAGTLGGTGRISGAVTVASGSTPAVLAPGIEASPGALTLLSTLTFNSFATYQVDVNSSDITVDQVVANDVTIDSGAQVAIDDLGTGSLPPGTVFTIINSTGTTPIAGTFSNLPDGSTITVGTNTYLVSYESGTGNDLTLTVQ